MRQELQVTQRNVGVIDAMLETAGAKYLAWAGLPSRRHEPAARTCGNALEEGEREPAVGREQDGAMAHGRPLGMVEIHGRDALLNREHSGPLPPWHGAIILHYEVADVHGNAKLVVAA